MPLATRVQILYFRQLLPLVEVGAVARQIMAVLAGLVAALAQARAAPRH
jgi:hypothetical protein